MAKKGERAERRKNDHYVTPAWAVHRFLEKYKPLRTERVLDPCAARGELIEAAQAFLQCSEWAACEIDPVFEADLREVTQGATVIADFLKSVLLFRKVGFDLVLTNPPYNQALAFIQAALQVGRSESGHHVPPAVAMLLRINFLAGQARNDFLAQAKPGIFVLPNRPSFTGDGADQTEYAWFVFGDPYVAGKIEYCEVTPLDEIKASNRRARLIHTDVAEVAA